MNPKGGFTRFFIMKMNIYWLLFADDPQGLQDLADFNKKKYGQNISKPINDFKPTGTPYVDYDFEKEMEKAPEHQKRVK